MYNWNTPIRYVRGLGPTKTKELAKIKINTVGDLLEYQPLSYIYLGGVTIADAKEGHVVIKATVKDIRRHPFKPMVSASLSDKTGSCQADWYNSPWLLTNLHPGMTVTFWGKYKGGVLQQPKWTTVESSLVDVYGGQYGVHHATIRAALKEVLAHTDLQCLNKVELPDTYNEDRVVLFRDFHFPSDKGVQRAALEALKFDECLMLQLALAERRKGRRQQVIAPTLDFVGTNIVHAIGSGKIVPYFPFEFTDEQWKAIGEVIGDIQRGIPMHRLIHGEVGSGKTAVAFYAAMLAALNHKRTLILAPTTILAHQHYDTLWNIGWEDLALYCAGEEKQPANWYKANIIIGTHAMLNNEELLKSASLVIIDEFQKFGVEQRAKIQRHNPHLLLLSATPIPRTLAASVFGDLDVSTIRQLPIERGTVVTRWVLPEKREGMYEIIEKELAKGKQAYVVYPRISGGEDVVSAERGYKELRKRFGFHRVGLLIGRDKPEYKATILRSFKGRAIDILVSTIIAEVGLDNPNATVMVVEGADRFGLSQLHQLRGRVCRSTDTAFCFLVSETANEKSITRLEVIERCNDGFEIAEADLRLRGPGELFSTRQHGLPDLKFASLVDDYDLMIEARDLVQTGDIGDGVREMMKLKYGDNLQLGEVT